MIIKHEHEIKKLIEIGRIVSEIRETLASAVKEGITTNELDKIAFEILERNGANSAPIRDYNFPGNTCISINETAAHGIPSDYVIKTGDMINIDVSAELDGYYADTGMSLFVPAEDSNDYVKRQICYVAKLALENAIKEAKPGNRIFDIGRVIHKTAKDNGFTVLMNLTGHGIGRALHESPKSISNYFCKSENQVIKNGQVLAIETFIANGTSFVTEGGDGWSLVIPNGELVAQFEHTIIVCESKNIITTI